MNKCPDTVDHDEYSITLDRKEMPLEEMSCHNTEPMNTQQECDALEESMATADPVIPFPNPSKWTECHYFKPLFKDHYTHAKPILQNQELA